MSFPTVEVLFVFFKYVHPALIITTILWWLYLPELETIWNHFILKGFPSMELETFSKNATTWQQSYMRLYTFPLLSFRFFVYWSQQCMWCLGASDVQDIIFFPWFVFPGNFLLTIARIFRTVYALLLFQAHKMYQWTFPLITKILI
jgi:hypothetical protein